MNTKAILKIYSVKSDDFTAIVKTSDEKAIEVLHKLIVSGEVVDFVLYNGEKSVIRLNNYYVGYMHLDGSHVVLRLR